MNFKIILTFFLVILLGLATGAGFAFYQLKNQGVAFQLNNGPWVTSTKIGSEEETLFLRAYVALNFLFALPQSEVIYFIANKDSEGNPLDAKAQYILKGKKLPARYWSITMYAEDHFLVPNAEKKYSFNLDNLEYEKEGAYLIYLSQQKKKGNWLPTPSNGHFILGLRLYNLAEGQLGNLERLELPEIIKIRN